MADNDWAPAASGAGPNVATKDIAGVRHQQVIPEGKASDWWPNNTDHAYTEAQVDETFTALNPDGSVITRGAVTTDELSFSTSFPGVAMPTKMSTVTGTGQTIAVANSICTITAGATSGAEAYWQLPCDYLPLHIEGKINISQRIANQDIYFECASGATPAADTQFVRFHFTGTTATNVRCETQSSTDSGGSEGTAEDLTIQATNNDIVYHLEITQDEVHFEYTDTSGVETVLTHRRDELPDVYTVLNLRLRVKNGTSPASSTTITNKWIRCANVDRLDVGSAFSASAIPVKIVDEGNTVIAHGEKTHNGGVPANDAIEVLTAIANAAAPTYTEGRLVLPRVTLSGDTAVTLDGESVTVTATNLDIRDLAATDIVTAVQATGTNLHTVVDSGTITPAGNVAHGAADSGNPVKIGGRAETSLATITPVTDGQRCDFCGDADGAQHVRPYCASADSKSDRIADTAGTSVASAVFTAVASTRNYITTISIFNSSATDAYVDFRDGTAGSIIFTAPAPKGGGSVITFPVPLRQPTVNTALAYDVSGAITTMYISVVGFQSKL